MIFTFNVVTLLSIYLFRPAANTATSVADLKRMAELWAKRNQGNVTPRASPSPMIIESTPADATPLIDEY